MGSETWVRKAKLEKSPVPNIARSVSRLEQSLRSAGYHLYNPIRSNWGPGFVFSGDVSNGRIVRIDEICPNLYADATAPNQSKILLPNYKTEDNSSLRIALDYLKKASGFANDDADLARIEQQRTADITWGNIRANARFPISAA
jgi:hypothetical protein